MASVSMASAPVRRRDAGPGYWFPALVAVGAIGISVLYAALGVYGAWRVPDHFDRTVVGGSLTADVTTAGLVVIYHEGAAPPLLGQLGLAVTGPDGAPVAVDPYLGELLYDRNDALGAAVATFTAPTPGPYQITSDTPHTGDWLAVGADIGGMATDAVGRAGLIAGLGLVAALAFAARAFAIARRRENELIRNKERSSW